MTQIDEVKIMNDTMILYLKKLGMSYKRNEIIKKMLEDESCFFKMKKEDAYMILKDVGIQSENIDNVYAKLISNDVYYDLYKKGKIDDNDDELVVKYKIYDTNPLLKRNKSNIKEKNENKSTNHAPMEYKESFFTKIFNKLQEFFSKNMD